MKMNDKMKEVQRKYREEIKKRNKSMKKIKTLLKKQLLLYHNCIVYFFHLHLARFLTRRSLFLILIRCSFPHNKRSFFIYENIKET